MTWSPDMFGILQYLASSVTPRSKIPGGWTRRSRSTPLPQALPRALHQSCWGDCVCSGRCPNSSERYLSASRMSIDTWRRRSISNQTRDTPYPWGEGSRRTRLFKSPTVKGTHSHSRWQIIAPPHRNPTSIGTGFQPFLRFWAGGLWPRLTCSTSIFTCATSNDRWTI